MTDRDIDDLEAQIRNQVTTLRPAPRPERARAPQPSEDNKAHLIMEVCQQAAEMVRGVHAYHKAEGETLAQHLEGIGEAFNKLCQEAAKKVRDLRIVPTQMSEDIANELLSLGQQEEQRHETVTRGLLTAREALLGIQGGEKKPG